MSNVQTVEVILEEMCNIPTLLSPLRPDAHSPQFKKLQAVRRLCFSLNSRCRAFFVKGSKRGERCTNKVFAGDKCYRHSIYKNAPSTSHCKESSPLIVMNPQPSTSKVMPTANVMKTENNLDPKINIAKQTQLKHLRIERMVKLERYYFVRRLKEHKKKVHVTRNGVGYMLYVPPRIKIPVGKRCYFVRDEKSDLKCEVLIEQ